jgi:hypothetical protein
MMAKLLVRTALPWTTWTRVFISGTFRYAFVSGAFRAHAYLYPELFALSLSVCMCIDIRNLFAVSAGEAGEDGAVAERGGQCFLQAG